MPNAERIQRRLVMRLGRVRSPEPVKRMKARSRARPGLGLYQPGSFTSSGSIRSMSTRRGRGRAARRRRPAPGPGRPAFAARFHVLGVGDDARDLAELGLALDLAVGAKQDGNGAQAVERGDHGERGRARLHQDAHVLALVDADRDQAPDDRVDAVLGRRVGVRAVLEEEEDLLGMVVGLLVEELAERDAGPRPDLVEADQARQLGEWPPSRSRARCERCGRRPRRTSAPGSRRRPPASAEAVAGAGRRARGSPSSATTSTWRMVSGSSASASRQRVQPATEGQVVEVDADPTTRPK